MREGELTFGDALRHIRNARGLSQAKLAKRVKVDPTYVSHMERGERDPSLSLLREMAEALDVPAVSLFALLIWEHLPPGERTPFEGFVATVLESDQLLGELDRW